jgi:predicted metal-dependent peptidase
VERIREFVIVLDVSMSTSGELVRNFLNQTYEVLTEKATWLSQVHIRIIQCDDAVREDVKITSPGELGAYMQDFTLKGGGGTDFRPAFAHVRQLLDEKALAQLKGMIYFTDGKGTYPKVKPPWDTAFVFLEEDYQDVNVPPWAIKLILPMEEILGKDRSGFNTESF